MIGAIKQQARDLFAELDRVDWPSKEKVLSSTWTVVIVSVFTGVYLWAVDWVFAKGFAGGGWLNGGSLDDEDFLAGQIKFSDTFSRIQGNSLGYVTIDLGYDFKLIDGASKLTIGPYAGFNYWGESQVASGLRCNRDDVDDRSRTR